MKYVVWSKTIMDLIPHVGALKKLCNSVDSKLPQNFLVEVTTDEKTAFREYCQQHQLMISRPNKFRLLQK